LTTVRANPSNGLEGCLILDACCVLNFLASDQLTSIMTSIPQTIVIAEYVYTEEILPVQAKLFSNRDQASVLQTHINASSLNITSLNSAVEESMLVNLAVEMDDGEAHTCAIALCRNWDIASDDHKVLTVLKRVAPHIRMITTPELLRQWANVTSIDANQLCTVLKNIQTRANYWPGPKHPLYAWWQTNIQPK